MNNHVQKNESTAFNTVTHLNNYNKYFSKQKSDVEARKE